MDADSDGYAVFFKSGILSYSAAALSEATSDFPCDFIFVLGLAQKLNVDFLPVTWQPALDIAGEGLTAKIYQAPIDLQLTFAFKRFRKDDQDPNRIYERIVSELLVLGQPPIRTHPNVVQLEGLCFDIGPETQQIWPVLMFRRSEYGDLDRFARSNNAALMTYTERMKLCMDVCSGVSALHKYGIVHGDVGPRNVLVFEDAEHHYIAKVADFGYSTLNTGDSTATIIKMTKTRPWYAPEWHHRGFRVADAMKMDVFSFAMLSFWFLFRDRQGFPADEDLERMKVDGSILCIAQAMVNELVSSEYELRQHLTTLFTAALNRDPTLRANDCEALRNLLYPVIPTTLPDQNSVSSELKYLPAPFEVVSSMYQFYLGDIRLRLYIRKCLQEIVDQDQGGRPTSDRIKQAAFQLALCYQVGFGVRRDPQEARRILQKHELQIENLKMSTESLRSLNKLLKFNKGAFHAAFDAGHVGEIDFDRRHSAFRHLHMIEAEYHNEIKNIQEFFGNDHPFEIMVKSQLVRMLNAHGKWKTAEGLAVQCLEQSTKLFGKQNGNTMRVMEALAVIYSNNGKFLAALQIEEDVLTLSREREGLNHENTLARTLHLAITYMELGRFAESETLIQRVLKLRTAALGPEAPQTLTSMSILARLCRKQGKFNDSQQLEEKVVRIREKVLGEDHPDTLSARMNLGSSFIHQGQLLKAEELFTQLVEKDRAVLGDTHPDTLSNMSHLASVLAARGNLHEAEQLLIQVDNETSAILGTDHPDVQANLRNLCSVYKKQGRWNDAEIISSLIMKRLESSLGPQHIDTLKCSANLSSIWWQAGRLDDAEQLASRTVTLLEDSLGLDHPDTLQTTVGLASIYLDKYKLDEAESLLMKSLDRQQSVLGVHHLDVLATQAILGRLYLVQDDYVNAEESLGKVIEIQTTLLGPEHPDTLSSKSNLALVKRYLGRFNDSKALEMDVLDCSERILGLHHPDTLVSKANLALTLSDLGQVQEAESLHREVVEAMVTQNGPDHPDTLAAMDNLTSLLITQERWSDAETFGAKTLAGRKKVLGRTHPCTLQSVIQMKTIYESLAHHEQLRILLRDYESVKDQEHSPA